MMLSAFLPRMQQRYAFAGSAVGALLPIFCFSVEAALFGPAAEWFVLLRDPTHILMALMPVFCGIVFYRIGWTRYLLSAQLEASMAAEKTLYHQARHDRLTGLANRMALEHEIHMLSVARKCGRLRPAILLLDLDKFKYINDTMGHDNGDALLVAISRRLKANLGSLSRLFRLGGDEFVITVTGVPTEEEITRLCEAIQSRLGQPFELKGGQAVTGVSIGITFMDQEDATMGQILKRADLALYKAKQVAGSNHVFYSPELGKSALARRKVERDLVQAIHSNELYVEYQPIVSAESRNLQSFEALVRWNHPEAGILAPKEFIHEAERNGLIVKLGNWVLKTSCRDAALWPGRTGLAVNVSGEQFKDRLFPEFVLQCLEESGLEPARLTLEITESAFQVDSAILKASLARLRAQGVRIALDDFGAGFSSISYLKLFPVDYIKVDRSFALAMMESNLDAELVDIMVRLGQTFNISTTIEGIETETQMRYVQALGAEQVQGYLISRPVSAENACALITRSGEEPPDSMFKKSA